MYQEALSRQLALDYCCSPADVADSKNHFTIYVPQEGRRRFQEQTVCRLKIAVVNGKLLDRKSTRLNSSHHARSRMPSSA